MKPDYGLLPHAYRAGVLLLVFCQNLFSLVCLCLGNRYYTSITIRVLNKPVFDNAAVCRWF